MEAPKPRNDGKAGGLSMRGMPSAGEPGVTRKVGRPKKTAAGVEGAGGGDCGVGAKIIERLDQLIFWTQLNVYYSMNSSNEFDTFVRIMEQSHEAEKERRRA
jgi:hypothetical protein